MSNNSKLRSLQAFALLRTLFFVIVFPAFVALWAPVRIAQSYGNGPGQENIAFLDQVRSLLPPTVGDWHWLGLALLVPAAYVMLRCAIDFAIAGLGTPAPFDPPRKLVVGGFYRWVRNPMYMGLIMALVGEAVLLASFAVLIYAVCCWTLAHLFVLLYEEPHLKDKFGSSYEEFCKQVPRWIPRVPQDAKSRATAV